MTTLNTMFKQNANTLFNRRGVSCAIIARMHEQMERLYRAAKELRQTEGQTEVAKLMDSLPQTLNNWESRGISDPGLLKAQEAIGCDAIWLRDGSGSMTKGESRRPSGLDDITELVGNYALADEAGKRFILDASRAALRRGGKQ